jgi:hypothetical protein
VLGYSLASWLTRCGEIPGNSAMSRTGTYCLGVSLHLGFHLAANVFVTLHIATVAVSTAVDSQPEQLAPVEHAPLPVEKLQNTCTRICFASLLIAIELAEQTYYLITKPTRHTCPKQIGDQPDSDNTSSTATISCELQTRISQATNSTVCDHAD